MLQIYDIDQTLMNDIEAGRGEDGGFNVVTHNELVDEVEA